MKWQQICFQRTYLCFCPKSKTNEGRLIQQLHWLNPDGQVEENIFQDLSKNMVFSIYLDLNSHALCCCSKHSREARDSAPWEAGENSNSVWFGAQHWWLADRNVVQGH